MTPENQVKEIVKMLSPEDPNTTDAVFLVQKYIEGATAKLAAQVKQIALLEAQLEARSKEKHDVINQKLESERRLNKEKEDLVKREEERSNSNKKPGPGGGRTM